MEEKGITQEQGLIGIIIISVFLILTTKSLRADITTYINVYILLLILSLIYYRIIPEKKIIVQKGLLRDIKFYLMLMLIYMISATASSIIILLNPPNATIIYMISYFALIALLFPYKQVMESLET